MAKKTSPRGGGYNVATPGKLLDAAERLFGRRHYEAVTLREIAEEAESSVGQIVYHFGQKEALLREVILRRAGELTDERIQVLDDYERLVGESGVQVEPLVRAFVDPYFQRLASDDEGWRSYALFIGRSVWDGKLTPIFSEAFNRAAARYLAALRRAAPVLSEGDAVRAFQFMLAAIYGSTTNDTRISNLSGDPSMAADYAGYRAVLIPYVVGGIERLARKRAEELATQQVKKEKAK